MKLISPLTGPASGFPEYTPAQQRAFNLAVARLKTVYESFGFTPLETAAVEKTATLTSKGIDAKEVYGLRRLAAAEGEDGSKDVALRFDLTVPLARYVTANQGQLAFPFRRYQIQPVWRGERAQAGRYRQFYQCDIDTVGDGSLPLAADAEILAAGFRTLEALGVGKFTLRVNNRKLLQALVEGAGFKNTAAAIKVIDGAEKTGWEQAEAELKALGGQARQLGALLHRGLDALDATGPADELRQVITLARALLGLKGNDPRLVADLTIARGLDYYTGTVVETTLADAPELGSIMSGGRYDNLAADLGKKKMPGVGISIGLSRLMAYLLTLPEYQLSASPAQVLVCYTGGENLPNMATLAQGLRTAGLNAEQNFSGKELGKQLMAAEKRGIEWAVTAFDGTIATLRHLPTRKDRTLPAGDIPTALR